MRRRFSSRSGAARRLSRLALSLGAIAFVAACSDDSTAPDVHELDGPTVTVGNGTARTFVIEQGNTPTSVGIELSASALDGLPSSMGMWMLPMPSGAAVPPWDHAELDWNPQGHPPPGIYDLPHFDFHFYTIPVDEQMTIPGGSDTETVASQYVPQDYASQIESVPAMGVHWADTLAAEYHGHTFDRTFIYGFFHKQMVFVEPMVTLAFIQSHPDVTMPVKQPAAFQTSGSYPAKYSVRWDAAHQTVRVALENLTTH